VLANQSSTKLEVWARTVQTARPSRWSLLDVWIASEDFREVVWGEPSDVPELERILSAASFRSAGRPV
jgi:hypothetical protein